MSFGETIFLFVLALIIFGPKKLPEIARQVGRYLNEFKRASNEFKAQIEQEISHLEREKTPQILPPSAPPEGTTSRDLYAGSELSQVTSGQPEPAETVAPAVETTSDPGANGSEPHAVSTEPAAPAEAVTTATSQESHA